MTAGQVLSSRLARLAPLAAGVEPEPPASQPVYPAKRMQVLLPHHDEPELAAVDRFARKVTAPLRRLDRPQGRLRRIAKDIAAGRAAYETMDERALDQAIRQMAQRARFDHSAAAPRSGALEAEALGLVAEVVQRTQGFYPHQVQFMAAIALLDGQMAEMATGEGKTITAAMAAVVSAWRGLPCHVVTANDYLAARDCEIGQPLSGHRGLGHRRHPTGGPARGLWA